MTTDKLPHEKANATRRKKAAVEELHEICGMALKHWKNLEARPAIIKTVIASAEGALRDLGDAK